MRIASMIYQSKQFVGDDKRGSEFPFELILGKIYVLWKSERNSVKIRE